MDFPYKFIAIEGNIGAGKTTLCKILAELSERELILEQFTDNPFLENFYRNQERFALQVELFFLSERFKQLKDHEVNSNLFDQKFISDYIFVKSLLFAVGNLKGKELELYRRIYDALASSLPLPDIIFYLHRTPQQLLKLIKKRDRSYERDISENYLEKIQAAYFNYFSQLIKDIPVVIIDSNDMEFEGNPDDLRYFLNIMQSTYTSGTHYIGREKGTLFD